MDEQDLPTAEELGISHAEYARILRDLQERHGVTVPHVPPDAQPVAQPGAQPVAQSPAVVPAAPSGLQRSSRWWVFAVVAVATAIVLLPRLDAADEPEPVYAFLATDGGQPVAYSSCQMIQVAVYPAGGPPDAEQLVREAVARVRGVTGLDIVVVGAYGGHAPNWNFEAAPIGPGDPVSVSWQNGAAIEQMTDDVAGLGGSPVVTSVNGTRYRVAGTIALSRDYYALLSQRGDHDQAVAILLHEFGHVLGLDHVDSSRELMSESGSGQHDYGPGDLEGLRRLGKGPCI